MFTKLRIKSWQNFSPAVRKIATSISWLFADNILRMGVSLVIGVWVARYLGPNQFGLLNYAIAFAGLFMVFAQAGLRDIVVRDLVTDTGAIDDILGTAFMLKLISGSIAFILAVATVSLVGASDPQMPWLVSIIAFGLVFQSLEIIDFWFQSQVRSDYTVYAKNVAYLLITVAKILLITCKAPLIAFAIVTFVEVALSSICLAIFYRIAGYSFTVWRANSALAIAFLKQAWPNILAGVSITIYMRIDQLMLGDMLGNEAVGTYAVGVRLAEVWYFIPGAIVSSVTPSIIQAKQEGEKIYYDRLQNILNLLVVIFYSIGIVTTCLSAPIISTLYGAKYASSSLTLAIYVWSGVFVSLGLLRSAWIATEGLFRFGSLTTFIGAVANVLLNLGLIPRYGAAGAALATVLSYGLSDYLILLFYPRSHQLFWQMTKALSLDFIFSKLRLLINQRRS